MLHDEAIQERALGPLWGEGGVNTARIDHYIFLTGLTLPFNHRETISEFVSAMMLESGLNNLSIGNNAVNGSDNPWLGIGWCQLDTGFHIKSLDHMHEIRDQPSASLRYLLETPDLMAVGGNDLWFNKRRWHAWWDRNNQRVNWQKIDPIEGFSPYKACLESWDRLFGGG